MRNAFFACASLLLSAFFVCFPDDTANGATVEPPPRFWHAVTGNGQDGYASSRLYVFGGQGGATGWPVLLGDFWYYGSDGWRVTPTGRTKPGVRDGVGLSCGAGKCVLANGRRAGTLKETWVYTESTATWSKLNCKTSLCPSGRGFPAAAYDPTRSQHVLFGGDPGTGSSQYLDDTYTFAGGQWTARPVSSRPPARATAAATFVPGGTNMVVMYGGAYYKKAADANYYHWDARCDMWAWDGSRWLSITMTNAGPCLAFPAMAWDPVGNQLIVASGEILQDGVEIPNRDVWYFRFDSVNRTTGRWTKDAGSGFLSCALNASPNALAAYDLARRAAVFFGGLQNTQHGVQSFANTTVCQTY